MKNKLLLAFLTGVNLVYAQLSTTPGISTIPGVWYSTGKTVFGYATKSPLVLDGNFDEYVWSQVGYNPTTKLFPNVIGNKISRSVTADGTIPPDDRFVGNATFGVAWDDTYLYIGYAIDSPKDVDVLSWEPDWSQSGVGVFIDLDNIRSAHASINDYYVAHIDETTLSLYFGYIKNILNQYYERNPSAYAGFGVYNIKNHSDGFITKHGSILNIEIRIEWAPMNALILNEVTEELDEIYKVKQGRTLGFDLTYFTPYDIREPNSPARTYWNACCRNRNWAESVNYGVLSLIGFTGETPLRSVEFSKNSMTVSGNNTFFPAVDIIPADANKKMTYQVYNSDNNKPTLIINNEGQITPLNEGVATIVGFSAAKVFDTNNFIKSVTSTIVTITNVESIESFTIEDAQIITNWQDLQLQHVVQPSSAHNEVTWEVVDGHNLGYINSITGILSSYSVGDGVISVKATPVAYPSKAVIKQIPLMNQVPLVKENITIASVGFRTCNGLTSNRMTISGYSISQQTKIPIRAYYTNPQFCSPQLVDERYIDYKLRGITGLPVPITISRPYREGDFYYLIPNTPTATFDIFATSPLYENLTVSSRIRIRQELASCENNITIECDNAPISAIYNYSTYVLTVNSTLTINGLLLENARVAHVSPNVTVPCTQINGRKVIISIPSKAVAGYITLTGVNNFKLVSPYYHSIYNLSQNSTTVSPPVTTGGINPNTLTGGINTVTGIIINDFYPKSGVSGNIISVSGIGFTSINSVMIAGTQANYSLVSDNVIMVVVPSSAKTGLIKISGGKGTATSKEEFVIQLASANQDFNNDLFLKVYPNPSTGLVHFEVDKIADVEIFNSQGICIESLKMNGKLDKQFEKGLYLIKANFLNKIYQTKLIVE